MGDLKQQAHWKWVSDWGEEKFNGWLDRWDKELRELIDVRYDGMVTLNIGAGPIPLRFKNAKEEILLDNNYGFFKDMFPKKYCEGMTILDEDIETTSLKDDSVDYIYCRKTLEYIQDWKKALDEMVRVLKVGGYIILMFHEKQHDGINLNLIDRFELADYLGGMGIGLIDYLYDESTTFVKIAGVKKDVKRLS